MGGREIGIWVRSTFHCGMHIEIVREMHIFSLLFTDKIVNLVGVNLRWLMNL